MERDHGQKGRPDVVAAFGLHRCSWYACLLFTVPWFLQRRVPRFPAEHVAFRRERSRLAVRAGTFSCLPGDPAANEPGARVVPDEEALRAEVRAAFAEHIQVDGPRSGLTTPFRPPLSRPAACAVRSTPMEIPS